MPRIGGRLEFPLLLAAQAEFLAKALDAMNSDMDAVIIQIGLQSLGAVGVPRSLMRCPDLDFQRRIRVFPERWRTLPPGVVAAFRYTQHPTHGGCRVGLSQFINSSVFHRDSLVKYVANFFSRSRSIFTSASSLRVLVSSSSNSLGKR